jgi:hypothetical protein
MATEIEAYLAGLPSDRRGQIETVREIVLANLPEGLVETMDFGMIAYVVPLERCPDTYNGKPLLHTALANQKNHMAVYLMGIYGSADVKAKFEADYRATGLRYDAGASCVRFRKLDDLPLDVLANAIRAVSVEDLIAMHEGVKSLRKAKS